VVSELAAEYSHAMAQKSLPQWLREQEIPCLAGVDTRALTKRLRNRAAMLGKIWSGGDDVPSMTPIRGIWWGGQWKRKSRISRQRQNVVGGGLRRQGQHRREPARRAASR